MVSAIIGLLHSIGSTLLGVFRRRQWKRRQVFVELLELRKDITAIGDKLDKLLIKEGLHD